MAAKRYRRELCNLHQRTALEAAQLATSTGDAATAAAKAATEAAAAAYAAAARVRLLVAAEATEEGDVYTIVDVDTIVGERGQSEPEGNESGFVCEESGQPAQHHDLVEISADTLTDNKVEVGETIVGDTVVIGASRPRGKPRGRPRGRPRKRPAAKAGERGSPEWTPLWEDALQTSLVRWQ
jgi:hypothetical protein